MCFNNADRLSRLYEQRLVGSQVLQALDDGVEGYLSPRLTPDGIPVCSGLGVEDNAYAPFKDGTFIPDPL